MSKGFASLTKAQRQAVGSKGGSNAQLKGTGHQLNALTARSAAMKGVAVRRQRRARAAALVLLAAGLTPEQLDRLQLSEEELIWFGGSKRTQLRFSELLQRLEDNHDSSQT